MNTPINYSENRSCHDSVVRLISPEFESAEAWNGLNADCRPSSSSSAVWNNFTRGSTTTVVFDRSPSFPVWHVTLFGLLAVGVCLLTISGNLIVILSFVLERSIRQPTNYFIASLAVSDLLIGSVSMPFYTIYLLSGKYWPLGEALCDLWLSLDYTACLCSIYTVFCITADRYCSVRLPASYRKWRTQRKVTIMVGLTWLIPMAVFFTSIFGWQHFVGYRSVPAGKCYVQYMEDALFNCLLQVGYFWITLAAMIALYVGIYRIALGLHRRSVAQRERSIACLVSMAGGAVTQIGSAIGMTRTPDGRSATPLAATDTPPAAVHDDDDDDDDDVDCRPTVQTSVEPPHVTSRLLLPAASFAFFSRLGATRRQDVSARFCSDKTTSSSPRATVDNTLPPAHGTAAVKSEASLSKPQSTAVTCSERSGRAAELSGKLVSSSSAADRRHKRDAASTVGARPEDLHDLPFFDDDDDDNDDRLPRDPTDAADEVFSPKISTPDAALSSTTVDDQQRFVRFEVATDDDVPVFGSESDTSPMHHHRQDAAVQLGTLCNGGRRLATHSSSSTSSHQLHHRFTSGLAGHVWRHVVVHREGRHAESRLEKSTEPDERQSLLRTSCQRHGDAERKRLQLLTRNNHRTRKALRTITIILGAFMICWIPWHVLSLIIGFSCEHGTLSCSVAPTLYDISYWICYLNSPINPFCYAFANQQFKKTFIRIMQLDWRRS